MRQDENGNYIPTPQQKKMIRVAGVVWSRERQPDLQALIQIWCAQVSSTIPLFSILEVYDYLIETGYYNPFCL